MLFNLLPFPPQINFLKDLRVFPFLLKTRTHTYFCWGHTLSKSPLCERMPVFRPEKMGSGMMKKRMRPVFCEIYNIL